MLISPLNGHSRKTEQNKKPLTLASEVKYLTTQHSLFCIKKCLTKISQVTVRWFILKTNVHTQVGKVKPSSHKMWQFEGIRFFSIIFWAYVFFSSAELGSAWVSASSFEKEVMDNDACWETQCPIIAQAAVNEIIKLITCVWEVHDLIGVSINLYKCNWQ